MPVPIICKNPECRKTFYVKPSHASLRECCSSACQFAIRKAATDRKYIGKKFGKLTVLHRSETDSQKWICRCDCGNFHETKISHLIEYGTVSCGCHRSEVGKNMIFDNRQFDPLVFNPGDKFGRWTVIENLGVINEYSWSLCQCNCGTERKVMNYSLKTGASKSCGCYHKEVSSEQAKRLFTKHGLSSNPHYLRHMKHRRHKLDQDWTAEMEIALREIFPKCVICGSIDRLATDHVRPVSKGNGLSPGNAIVLCKSCNSTKCDKDLDQLPKGWKKKILAAANQFQKYWDGL